MSAELKLAKKLEEVRTENAVLEQKIVKLKEEKAKLAKANKAK